MAKWSESQCRAPGILLVCKQVRELAVPIFYVSNSFEVRISNFYGEGTKDWWQRTEAQRKQVDTDSRPLDSNGTMHSVDQSVMIHPAKPILHEVAGQRPLSFPSSDSRNYKSALRNLELSSAAPAYGTITLYVAYEPNWQNLVTWLNSCIKAVYHKYMPTDLVHKIEGHRLQTAAWLFKITEQYPRCNDQALYKTIVSHRGPLILDDLGWSLDHVNEVEDDDEGMDFLDGAKDDHEMATARDTQLCSVAGSPAGSPILNSPSQYQDPRENLSPSFLATMRSMKDVDEQEVEDDSDYDMGGDDDTPGRAIRTTRETPEDIEGWIWSLGRLECKE